MDVAVSRSKCSSGPRRRAAADRAQAESALGSLPRGGSQCYSGDPLSPEDLDVLRRLTSDELLELVREPRAAEAGEGQAPLKLVDPGRNPVQVAIRPRSVLLHVYNLSSSIVTANSLLAFSMDGGVFHVGIEVYGSEFAYGVCGVSHLLPRSEEDHAYLCSLNLGETPLTRNEFAFVLRDMCWRWGGADYDVLGYNCCCFCSQMLERLNVGPMPLWVDRFSRLLLSGREAGRDAVLASIQGLLQGGAVVRHGLETLAQSAQLALDGALGLSLEPEADVPSSSDAQAGRWQGPLEADIPSSNDAQDLFCESTSLQNRRQVGSPTSATRLGGA